MTMTFTERLDLLTATERDIVLTALHDRSLTVTQAHTIIGVITPISRSTIGLTRQRMDAGEIDVAYPTLRPVTDEPAASEIVTKRVTRREGPRGVTTTTAMTLRDDRSDIDLPATMAYVREQAAKRHRAPRGPRIAERVGIVVIGDIQLGKVDALGGSPETIARMADMKEQVLSHAATRGLTRLIIVDPGDIVEGVESAGGKGLESNDLSPMMQVDGACTIATELVVEGHDRVAPVTYIAVPSNHAAFRRGGVTYGNPATDDWGIMVARRVEHTAKLLGLDVTVVTPNEQLREEAVVVEVFGEKIAVVHAHQTSRPDGVKKLAAGHAVNGGALQNAALTITGHFHHMRLEPLGRTASGRQGWWLQAMTADNGSSWYANGGGDVSDAGILYTEFTREGLDISALRPFYAAHELARPRPQAHVVA